MRSSRLSRNRDSPSSPSIISINGKSNPAVPPPSFLISVLDQKPHLENDWLPGRQEGEETNKDAQSSVSDHVSQNSSPVVCGDGDIPNSFTQNQHLCSRVSIIIRRVGQINARNDDGGDAQDDIRHPGHAVSWLLFIVRAVEYATAVSYLEEDCW